MWRYINYICMKKFEITEDVLNKVYAFISKCPFEQVEPLIVGLRKTAQSEIKTKKEEATYFLISLE